MKLTYKQRLFGWLFIIFALMTFGLIVFEQKEEKEYRTQALEARLDRYTGMIDTYINQHHLRTGNIADIDTLLTLFPDELRVTIVKDDGTVLFDNDKDIKNIGELTNHLDRPEIMKALYQSHGANIRMSASTDHEYMYYAKYYTPYFVRVALPYDLQIKSVLSPDRMFIYVALVMFLLSLILLNYAAGRFGKSISHLKSFTTSVKDGKVYPYKINFPNDELGEIGEQLTDIFKQKEQNELSLKMEKEKLIQHFQFSQNGLCIFDDNHAKLYANTRFIQYLNLLEDNLTLNVDSIFTSKVFEPVIEFLNDHKKGERLNNYSMRINKNGKIFDVQTVVFEDNSFEIGIKDVTELEYTRHLKQEMTNNIAHELRTPVTSLRAYLETLDSQELPMEKQIQFIHRAYVQSVRLSNIVDDVSLISKMEESGSQFKKERVDVAQIIDDVRIDLIDKITQHNIKLDVTLGEDMHLMGNYTLLYSIFRNLIDNSIAYAGTGVNVVINNYMADDNFLYFSYYDTGKGVDEHHLNRLFERFYRADEGRTRDSGGSGLGLSIVRNAVKFHDGEVQVKNRKDAGLEFLFTLRR